MSDELAGDPEVLERARGLLASGDIPGLLWCLRAHGETLLLGEVARLVAGAARLAGFGDLAQPAAAVAEGGDHPGTADARALYEFGYACTERGVGHLAVRPLAHALELAPDAAAVLSELVVALEQDGRHACAVAVLEDHEPVMRGCTASSTSTTRSWQATWRRRRRASDGCPNPTTPRGGTGGVLATLGDSICPF